MKIILGLAITIILIASIYLYFKKPKEVPAEDNKVTADESRLELSGTEEYITLSRELISKHKAIDDCWLYVDDSVYVVTAFLQMHSGGPDKISPYCGGDATSAFKSRVHSEGAKLLLKRLSIGKIDQKVLKTEVDRVLNDNLVSPE